MRTSTGEVVEILKKRGITIEEDCIYSLVFETLRHIDITYQGHITFEKEAETE